MKITKKLLKEMIEEILAEQQADINIADLLTPDVKKKLEKLESDTKKAVGLPATATATDVAKKVTSDAMKAGKDAAEAVIAMATAKPKTADEAAKIMQRVGPGEPLQAPDTGLTPLKIGAMSKMQSMASDADLAIKKAADKKGVRRKKARKRKCPKLPLRIGCQGPLVKEVQKLLDGLGYKLGRTGADGDFGRATRRAVMKFQRAEGISVDGVVGKETYGRLKGGEQAAAFAAPGKPKKATKAKKDTRVDTPIVGGAPEMSRVEALRATRDDMVPVSYTKRYRRPSNVRSLAIKAIKYLMDDAGVAPGQAYRDLIEVFGLGGARYFEPELVKRTALSNTERGRKLRAAAQKFKQALEGVLNIELDEL